MDEIEQFRNNFFKMLEKEKIEKEKVLKEKQRTCWHNLVLVNSMKICKKCGKISK
jgi:hypothetical protein